MTGLYLFAQYKYSNYTLTKKALLKTPFDSIFNNRHYNNDFLCKFVLRNIKFKIHKIWEKYLLLVPEVLVQW